MPVYEYACPDCGPFPALRRLAERQSPAGCPACGAASPRVIATPPALSALTGAQRRAHATNERAAHEPKSTARHGMSCVCCRKPAGRTAVGADGSKGFPAARPWMISH